MRWLRMDVDEGNRCSMITTASSLEARVAGKPREGSVSMDLEILKNTSIDHPGRDSTWTPAIHPRQSSGEKMRILVVEDDSMQRLVLVSLLTRQATSVAVSDGTPPGKNSSRSSFNIVFTDWMMPGMSGLELIRKIRAAGFGRYVYAIVCTGRSSRADLVEGLRAALTITSKSRSTKMNCWSGLRRVSA